jgi:hypothetical protein
MLNAMMSLSQTALANARMVNGNEGTATQDHLPDWIRIRSGSGAYGAGCFYTPWDSVAFPGMPNF